MNSVWYTHIKKFFLKTLNHFTINFSFNVCVPIHYLFMLVTIVDFLLVAVSLHLNSKFSRCNIIGSLANLLGGNFYFFLKRKMSLFAELETYQVVIFYSKHHFPDEAQFWYLHA